MDKRPFSTRSHRNSQSTNTYKDAQCHCEMPPPNHSCGSHWKWVNKEPVWARTWRNWTLFIANGDTKWWSWDGTQWSQHTVWQSHQMIRQFHFQAYTQRTEHASQWDICVPMITGQSCIVQAWAQPSALTKYQIPHRHFEDRFPSLWNLEKHIFVVIVYVPPSTL